MQLFITGTGTGVGKTFLTCALARAARARGRSCAAVKPLETGCAPHPLDALALAEACDRPELARWPGLYRAERPLAPYAATLMGEPALDLDAVIAATRAAIADADIALVEGAGGILVPLDAQRTIADLVRALDLPVVLVARDGLGVLSHTLTAVEAAAQRGLTIEAVVLAEHGPEDISRRTNRSVLEARLPCPVSSFSKDGEPLLAMLGRARLDRPPLG